MRSLRSILECSYQIAKIDDWAEVVSAHLASPASILSRMRGLEDSGVVTKQAIGPQASSIASRIAGPLGEGEGLVDGSEDGLLAAARPGGASGAPTGDAGQAPGRARGAAASAFPAWPTIGSFGAFGAPTTASGRTHGGLPLAPLDLVAG